MRTTIIVTLAALLALAVVPQGGATHECCTCPTYATSGVGGVGLASTEVGISPSLQLYVSAVKGNYYIVNDAVLERDWISSLWIYQEYNGDGGLQRHDDFCYTAGFNTPGAADLVIW